jgi:hypothetical protein
MGTISGFRTSRTGPEGNPLLKATIGISAPFSFYDLGTDVPLSARLADAFTELALVI